jgi:hypothetical protein
MLDVLRGFSQFLQEGTYTVPWHCPQQLIAQQTPRSRVVLEKLRVTQMVKKFPACYEIQQFITMFTTAHEVRGLV